MPLTEKAVKHAQPGRHQDGNGLSLLVADKTYRNSKEYRKKWVFRIQIDGKRQDIGLGSARSKSGVTLAEARDAAYEMRRAFRRGENPVENRKRKKQQVPTFREAALKVFGNHKETWKNRKHAKQWLSTLEAYAFPHFGDVPVNELETPTVRAALLEIWLTIPETARRVRQRVCTVLDYAHGEGFRDHETSSRALTKGFPKQPKKRGHFASMPWEDVPGFISSMPASLNASETVRLAMELSILTATRSGEVRLCRWHEVDLKKRAWVIPAERMKAETEHKIPLSPRAVAIFQRMHALRRTTDPDALVFEGNKRNKPFSDMTFTKALRRAGYDVTMHGFRSSFRNWVSETTSTPDTVAERALAHVENNKTRAAYERTDLYERRRDLMNLWATYCGGESNVKLLARRA